MKDIKLTPCKRCGETDYFIVEDGYECVGCGHVRDLHPNKTDYSDRNDKNIKSRLEDLKKQAEMPVTPKPTEIPANGYKWVYNQESKTWAQVPVTEKTHEVFDKTSTLLNLYGNEWTKENITDMYGNERVFSCLLEEKLIEKMDPLLSIKASLDSIVGETRKFDYYQLSKEAKKLVENEFGNSII